MSHAESAPVQLLTPRFEILSRLGEGGMGVVYEVRDRDTHATLAAKTLTAMTAEQVYWLKAEFRRLADVTHPNLVQLGELFYDGSSCFFTMERLHGVDLQRYVRGESMEREDTQQASDRTSTWVEPTMLSPRTSGDARTLTIAPDVPTLTIAPRLLRRFDEARLRHCFAQLAEGLRTLHGHGIVHRDLKPSNILVEPSGRLVVLDFGIAGSLQAPDNDNSVPVLRGTPSFMAPEQVRGLPPEPAADWYAFGVLLFYALTGTLPFSGTMRGQMLAKLELDAPAPIELVRDTPPDLNALCVQLLSREPGRRPRGEAVSSVLTRMQKRAPTSSYRVHRGVFVGRRHELTRLHEALARVERGAVVALAVEGAPGLGKTDLIGQFLFEAERAGKPLLVLTGRCYEQEFVSFKGLDAAIDALSHHLKAMDQTAVARMLPARFHLVAALFPVLYRVPAVVSSTPPAALNESKPEQRAEAVTQLVVLLAALAQDRRLVMFIDDLQWAGEDSLSLLRGLCEGPLRTPLLLLVTRRRATAAAAGQLAAPSIVPAPGEALGPSFEVVELAPLSADEASALTRQIFSGTDSTRVDTVQAELVLREAGGHPLFLRELARAIERGDVLPRELRLEHVLLARIAALSATSRKLIEAVAIAGVPLPEQVFARVANISRAESASLVRTLRGEQLVRTGTTAQHRVTLEPYHDRVREALVEGIAQGRYPLALGRDVPAVHLALARQLVLARAEDGLAVASAALAQQFQQGALALAREGTQDDALAAVEANLDAARQARLGAAYASAIRYVDAARVAAGLLSGEQVRLARRSIELRAMELALLSEDFARASETFALALQKSRGDRELAEVYQSRAQNQIAKSRHTQAIATARECLRALGTSVPERGSLSQVLRDAAGLELMMRGRSAESILALPRSSDERTRAQSAALMSMVPAAYFTDTLLMSSIAIKLAKLTLQHGLTDASGSAFSSYAIVVAGKFQQYERAYRLSQLAMHLNALVQNEALDCKLLVLQSLFCAPYIESVVDILSRLKEAQELGLSRGDLLFRTYAGISPMVFAQIAGTPLSEVIADSQISMRIAEQAGNPDMLAVSRLRLRAACALTGKSPEPLRLDGSSSSEEQLSSEIERPLFESARFTYGLVRAINGCHAGDYTHALHGARYAERFRVSQPFMPTLIDLDFYRAIAAARISETTALGERARLLLTAASSLRRLAHVARVNPRNFEAYHVLARGVLLASSGRPMADRAKQDLLAAYELSARHQQHNVTALACEQLALWEQRHGTLLARQKALRAALVAYERWEAWACARRVDTELAELA